MPSEQVVDEVVPRRGRITWVQLQTPSRTRVLACAAGDRQLGIAAVHERAFDGDLTAFQYQGPEALPTLAGDGAHAIALVGADLELVCRVVNFVGEHQRVAHAVPVPA